jgi:sulfur carrier protein ThiS adenylyltransferase
MANPYLAADEREKLERVRVGVAGAGGLGSNVAMHLVRAGVKRLVLCDFDIVSESNLNRQFFFRDQLGMKKVEALRDNLLRIEPGLELRIDDRHLDVAGVRALYADCDILVEALDAAATKAVFYNAFLGDPRPVIGASGLAGFGRSNAIRLKKLGNLYLAGDGEAAVSQDLAPQSPRVGIAAAMEANTVLALALGREI